jgi:signal transduction histidine kinase/CheY-like chemotaxis protein
LRRAAGAEVRDWEVSLVLDGRPVTLLLQARPHGDGIALLGSLVPEDFSRAVAGVTEAMTEIVDLNRQITRQKRELAQREQALLQSNEDLRESNRGVLALHAGLEDRAAELRLGAEVETRVVANVSHEFRTPLHSILGLSQLLLGRSDGPLTSEQETQVRFIRTAAEELSQLVDDLLDLSKLRGSVRVSARLDGSDLVAFDVADTGIGIAPEDQPRVFEEFAQIDSPLQKKVKGTGLGLPLSRRLAESLGGAITLHSAVGEGSLFTLRVPRLHPEAREMARPEERSQALDPRRAPVLVVEDDRKTIFLYERYLARAGFQVVPARSIDSAREIVKTLRPAAILLDIILENETSWRFLGDLKSDPATQDIPVLVVTVTDREQKARALGADEFWLKPVNQERLIKKLRSLSTAPTAATVPAIDDDESARYILRKYLADTPFTLLEAGDGDSGVELARSKLPHVILLDFMLEGMTAFDVLDQLEGDPRRREIPVIVITSQVLPVEERRKLGAQTEAVLSKEHLSRELAVNRIRDVLHKAGVGAQATARGTIDRKPV